MPGYQQVIAIQPGQRVNGEIKFQRWSGAGNPSEINQVFLLYSWSSNWNPPTHYTPLWNGISGAFPGVTKTVKFSFTAPIDPGTYYIWIRGDAMYTVEDAITNIWRKYHGPPPHNDAGGGVIGKITVMVTKSAVMIKTVTMPMTITRTKTVTSIVTQTVTAENVIEREVLPGIPFLAAIVVAATIIALAIIITRRGAVGR